MIQTFLANVKPIIEMLSYFIFLLVLLATLLVRITPTPKDDAQVSNFARIFLKILHWLPTFGINPQTQKLLEFYNSVKAPEVKKE